MSDFEQDWTLDQGIMWRLAVDTLGLVSAAQRSRDKKGQDTSSSRRKELPKRYTSRYCS